MGALPRAGKVGNLGSLMSSVGSDPARSCGTFSPAPYLLPML